MKFLRRESAAKLGEFVAGPFIPAFIMFVLSALWFSRDHWAFGVGSLAWGIAFAGFGIKDMWKPNKP